MSSLRPNVHLWRQQAAEATDCRAGEQKQVGKMRTPDKLGGWQILCSRATFGRYTEKQRNDCNQKPKFIPPQILHWQSCPITTVCRACGVIWIKLKLLLWIFLFFCFLMKLNLIWSTGTPTAQQVCSRLFQGDPSGDPEASSGARTGIAAHAGEGPAEPDAPDRAQAAQVRRTKKFIKKNERNTQI